MIFVALYIYHYDSIIVIDFSAVLYKRLWDFHFIYEYIMKISYSSQLYWRFILV